MIEFEDLTFKYRGSGRPALNSIDLRIESGEFLLITGESGSGKTTLARLMTGFLGPEDGKVSGRVRVDGKEVHPARMEGVETGLVQQDPESQMVTLNVVDEVAFGPENLGLEIDEIRERVSWALESCGASHLVGRSISTLSGGELQRIAIASILAIRPKVLILDEPTSSLDPRSAWEIGDVLQSLNSQGLTVVVIEHRYSWVAGKANRMVTLSHGRISSIADRLQIVQTAWRSPAVRRRQEAPAQSYPIVSLKDVSFRHGDRDILRDVTLDVKSGEVFALMGDNGSGKTTLLHILMGFLKPHHGSVVVCGGAGKKTSQIARQVGMVFQNPNHQILESTVQDEIMFGPKNFGIPMEEAEEGVKNMLDGLGLSDYRGDSPYRLSLGEKRRLNVGSVAVYEPEVYLLDEPFVGQDRGNVKRIMELVRSRIERGSSCIVVTHEPDFVIENCDRAAFLKEGRLVACDEPERVFSFLEGAGERWYLPSGWGE